MEIVKFNDELVDRWVYLTEKLDFENDKSKIENIKKELQDIIEKNRTDQDIKANTCLFARDLMESVKCDCAEGKMDKARYFFELLKEFFSTSQFEYAQGCYFSAEKIFSNYSLEFRTESRKATREKSMSLYKLMTRNKPVHS